MCSADAPKCRAPCCTCVIKAAFRACWSPPSPEIARRYPGWGGLVASLPLTSLLAMIWLWRDSRDPERVAELVGSTFWFILPSLPMFLVLAALLRSGMGFWLSDGARASPGRWRSMRCWFWVAPKVGIKL